MKRKKGLSSEEVFKDLNKKQAAARRAFRKHSFMGSVDCLIDYTILDIFSQGYFAGLRAKRGKK